MRKLQSPNHRQGLTVLADKPLERDADDRLGFVPYADALAHLIDSPETDTPLTIALSAPWGAGKTSLAKMVERRLKVWPEQRTLGSAHLTCWFNAWIHDDAPNLGSAFAAEVAKRANRERHLVRRLLSPLPSMMLGPKERFRRRILMLTLSLIVALAIIIQLREALPTDTPLLKELRLGYGAWVVSTVAALVALYAIFSKFFPMAESVAKFVDDPASQAARGSMWQVRQQLGRLVRQATRGKRRLVIFVDDLERCRPPRALEVCEVASQLLSHPDVVTVFVADMSVITSSAEIKYEALESHQTPQAQLHQALGGYGRQYLEKMVQIQFDLPSPARPGMEQMFTSIDGLPAESFSTVAGLPVPPQTEQQLPQGRPPQRDDRPFLPKVSLGISSVVEYLSSGYQGSLRIVGGGISLLAAVLSLGSVFFPTALEDIPAAILGWIVGAMAALFVGVVLARTVIKSRREKLTSDIDEAIRKQSESEEIEPEQIEEAIVSAGVLTDEEAKQSSLLNQRYQRYVTDESAWRREAESMVLQFLPPLPRAAKRMINHLRLLLAISASRGLLRRSSLPDGRYIGKWVVLSERWPDLVAKLRNNSEELAKLETAPDPESRLEFIRRLAPDIQFPEDLSRLLGESPQLANAFPQLLHLDPKAASPHHSTPQAQKP